MLKEIFYPFTYMRRIYYFYGAFLSWLFVSTFPLLLLKIYTYSRVWTEQDNILYFSMGNCVNVLSQAIFWVMAIISVFYIARGLYLKILAKKSKMNKEWQKDLWRGIAGLITANILYVIISLITGFLGAYPPTTGGIPKLQ